MQIIPFAGNQLREKIEAYLYNFRMKLYYYAIPSFTKGNGEGSA